jgi:hypothetical protein
MLIVQCKLCLVWIYIALCNMSKGINIYIHTYHSRFIPEGVAETSQIFLRDAKTKFTKFTYLFTKFCNLAHRRLIAVYLRPTWALVVLIHTRRYVSIFFLSEVSKSLASVVKNERKNAEVGLPTDDIRDSHPYESCYEILMINRYLPWTC